MLASVSEDARDESAIFAAVRRQASRVRATLGEALPLIRASERRLEKVTTPSLRALQLYSRGYARYREEQRLPGPRNHAVSAELFRQAIAEDPEFASAYNMLGFSVRFQDREEALRHWARAVELSPSTTERDRLFIEGVYYQRTGQLEKAVAKYEALLSLHPDHFYAARNLTNAYWERGLARPTEFMVRAADSRPNDPEVQIRAARLLTWTWQLDRAKVYVERASALGVPESPVRGWRDLFPAYEHWFRGEVDEAFREVEAVTRTIAAGSLLEREGLAIAASFYLAFGQLGKAKELFETLSDQQRRHRMLVWLADCLDDQEGLKEHMSALEVFPVSRFLLLYRVRAGLPLEPADLESAPVFLRQLARGELARRRRDWRDAIALLEPGVEGARETGVIGFYLGSESLATAWQQVGSERQALHVLEEAAQVKARYFTGGPEFAFARFRVQARLAHEYRKLGRIDEAVAIEDEVLHMLKYADDDHPVVRQIRASQASHLSASDSPVSTSARTGHS